MRAQPIRVLVISICLLVAGVASGWLIAGTNPVLPVRGQGVATTTADLLSRPKEFAGRRVLLRGRLSECFGWECALCPEAGHAGPCMQLDFRALMPGTGFGSAEQEALFRFASVVLSATFDPTCLTPGGCLDRPSLLRDAEVIAVTRRRASAEGFWRQTPTTALTPYEGALAAQMERAMRRAGLSENAPVQVFTTGLPNPRYVVCTSGPFDDRDPGKWPVTLEAALGASSSADRFRCREVRRVGTTFVAQIWD